MLLLNIKLAYMVLGLLAEILNPVDVIFLVCNPFRMIDTEMLAFRYIQHVITCASSLNRRCSRHNFALNNEV